MKTEFDTILNADHVNGSNGTNLATIDETIARAIAPTSKLVTAQDLGLATPEGDKRSITIDPGMVREDVYVSPDVASDAMDAMPVSLAALQRKVLATLAKDFGKRLADRRRTRTIVKRVK